MPRFPRRPLPIHVIAAAAALLLSLAHTSAPGSAQAPVVPGDSTPLLAPTTAVESGDGWANLERRLRAAIRLNPGEAAFHGSLARALARQGRVTEASESFRQAIALAPRVVEHRVGYAATLSQAGLLTEAEAQLRQALRLEPRSASLLVALADLLSRQDRLEEAAVALERAAQLDPSRPEYAELARAAQREARWSWVDGDLADGGARFATRLFGGVAAVILTVAGLALLLPLLGAIFLLLVTAPISLLRGRSGRAVRAR